MEERLDRVVSLPRESGSAEERMLRGDLVWEIAAVEKEIQSHNQQVESLTKRLEGLQSTGGESLRSNHSELVASGHDGRSKGTL